MKTDLFAAKVEITGEIGEALDKALEGAEQHAWVCKGKVVAYELGAKNTLLLHSHVDQDLEEGKIPDLEVASLVKKYISRAYEQLMNAAGQAKSEEVGAHGIAAGYRQALGMVQKHHNVSKSRLDQELAALADPDALGEDRPRPERGGRLSVADRRAEAASEASPSDDDDQAPRPLPPAQSVIPLPERKKKKKKLSRGKAR